MARAASFSTWTCVSTSTLSVVSPAASHHLLLLRSAGGAYGDFKIHHLLRKRAHLVVEAEAVLADIIGRKNKVSLPLLGAVEYDLVRGANDAVVHVEGAARLHLRESLISLRVHKSPSIHLEVLADACVRTAK
jgi:hypothetical protein